MDFDSHSKENTAFEKQLQSLNERFHNTKIMYKIALKEHQRLSNIVNYCFKNKADNHEWIKGLEFAVKNRNFLIQHE